MPDVYESGLHIPELAGVVRGGVTIVIHDVKDLDGLEALCSLVPQPPDDPMHAIYGALLSSTLNLGSWAAWRRRRPNGYREWNETSSSQSQPLEPWDALKFVLSAAREVWRNENEAGNDVSLTISVPDPDSNPQAMLEFDCENPALIFHGGSINVMLKWLKGQVKLLHFAVGLISGRGIASSQRAANLVESLRDKAEKSRSDKEQLPRLDKPEPEITLNNKDMIVLLHGLLSTDVGTFDGIINFLRKEGFTQLPVTFVGWPHDTLTSIRNNSLDLCRAILDAERKASNEGGHIAFIAHSRGGLVARGAAVELYKRSKKWKQRLRGCITFGTPHEGAALAESPKHLLGAFASLGSLMKTQSIASIGDILWYLRQRETIEGIEDLKPIKGGGQFLDELLREEMGQSPEDDERILKILAIGGIVKPGSMIPKLIVDRALAGVDHDLVVEAKSSMSHFLSETHKTDCDHFSYFNQDETVKDHYQRIAKFLKNALLPL